MAVLQETNEDAKASDLDSELYPEGTDCTEEDDISLGNATASGGKVSVDIDTSSSDFVVGNQPYDKLGNNIWGDWNGSSGSSLAEGTFRYAERNMEAPYVPSDSQRGANQITTVDGSGRTANVSAYFTITPTITPGDEGVQQGDELTILVEDWYYGSIPGATITIGDEEAEDGAFEIDVDREGNGEFKIEVPNSARLGDQELKVTGNTRDLQGALTFLSKDAARADCHRGAGHRVGARDSGPGPTVLGQHQRVH